MNYVLQCVCLMDIILIIIQNNNNRGPSGRSCHKIAFDSKLKRIYTLGRYVDYDEKGGK